MLTGYRLVCQPTLPDSLILDSPGADAQPAAAVVNTDTGRGVGGMGGIGGVGVMLFPPDRLWISDLGSQSSST